MSGLIMSSDIKPAAEQEVERHIGRKVMNGDSSAGRGMFLQETGSPRRRAGKQDVIYTTEHTAALNHHDNHLASTSSHPLNHIPTYATC